MSRTVSSSPDPATALPAWELEDAKVRFSELVRLAYEHGPQRITVRGQEAVVVLSAADYARLAPVVAKPTQFALFANSPFAGLEGFGAQLVNEKASVRDVLDF